ncbi:DUF1353 domain-containing protein [bacterium]|nr:DUF1353 domain-containing protein [bacterium]
MQWYKDKNLNIEFSRMPSVFPRYPYFGMSEEELKNSEKYPFLNRKDLQVRLTDLRKNKKYEFFIPKNYCWNGASIPRVFWRLIGSPSDTKFLIPSLIHDVLCENHNYVDNDRYFADKVFERLLYVSRVSAVNRWLMFHSVDNWQKFCKWRKK